ncbi:hypothetical protein [Paenibacillus sp. OV219]|uniref:hypothetical protein n=1 Tax=Paenibacillus sp. OV219 TaxID=1884377 RepID=UPI0008CFB2AA|nr:hypothetical protein [Paenibacillus sp. OV219]SEO16026.1 hypothetical protein SAMN05518847_106111 [Paenibacillus sp. OV219]
MPEDSKKDGRMLVLDDVATTILNNALIDYYLEKRNFHAIQCLQEQVQHQAGNCREVLVWAMDDQLGDYYIPEQAMLDIKAQINALAATPGAAYIADPLYFMDMMRERFVKKYLETEGNRYHLVPYH